MPPGVRIAAFEVGLARAQHDVREHHQHVGDGRAEDRDVEHRRPVLGDRREQEADNRRNDQRDGRHLAARGHRQRARQVARAREREQLARVGEDDREEAGDQADSPTVLTKSPTNVPSPLASSIAGRERVVGVLDRVGAAAAGRRRAASARRTRAGSSSPRSGRAACPASGRASPRRRAARPRPPGRTRSRTGRRPRCPASRTAGSRTSRTSPGSGSMLVRLEVENSGIITTTKTSSATTAIAVITNVTLSASPTPSRWMPTKAA